MNSTKKDYEVVKNEIRLILEQELVTDSYTYAGVTVSLKSRTTTTIDKEELQKLINMAKEAGLPVDEEKIFKKKKTVYLDIATPADKERRKKFAAKGDAP
jgi:hypothetical protein